MRPASEDGPLMLGWFQKLMPKEERFFELFGRHSEIIVAGAEELRAMLQGGDAVERHYPAVLAREEDADAITRDMMLAVRRTFITPFDRGDVQALISAMDDSIDQMKKTAKAIVLFKVREFEPDMRLIGDSIVECAGLLHQAIPFLRSMSAHAARLGAICDQIKEIEGRADDIHDSCLTRLFERCSPSNAMQFIAGNEVYDHLEKAVDRFDDIANEIQSIVVEHV
jgi:predicted phosphate transport protein (TIGR00153 family)